MDEDRPKSVHEELAKHLRFYLKQGSDPAIIDCILQVSGSYKRTFFGIHLVFYIVFYGLLKVVYLFDEKKIEGDLY